MLMCEVKPWTQLARMTGALAAAFSQDPVSKEKWRVSFSYSRWQLAYYQKGAHFNLQSGDEFTTPKYFENSGYDADIRSITDPNVLQLDS